MQKLRSLFLKPSLSCTARCDHCVGRMDFYRSLGNAPRSRLTLADYRRIIRESRALGAHALHLSGGEPTLYPQLTDLIAEGRECNMFVILNTNGSRIDHFYARELLRAGLDAVILSLHGSQETTHDRIKNRPGSFRETLRSIAAFRDQRDTVRPGFLLSTQTIVLRQNYAELPQILDLVCSQQVDGHGLSYVEGDLTGTLRLGTEEIRDLRQRVLPEALARLDQHRFRHPLLRHAARRLLSRLYDPLPASQLAAGQFGSAQAQRRCPAPRLFALVLADGSVLPCNMAEYAGGPILGSLRDASLAAVRCAPGWRQFLRDGFPWCSLCPTRLHFHIPISVGVASLVRLALHNPAEEQKSLTWRFREAMPLRSLVRRKRSGTHIQGRSCV